MNGSLSGKTFVAGAGDSVALKGVYGSAYPESVTVFISDAGENMCNVEAEAASGSNQADFFELFFTLGDTNARSIVDVGTYTLSSDPNELLTVGWRSYDGTCQRTEDSGINAASVTLTSVSSDYVGTFDFTFKNGDHVTGSFDTPECSWKPADPATDAGATCIPKTTVSE
ncbi:MAG: hypothetical protein ABI421_17595 [Polyangiaceae bacterium]